MVNEVPLLQFSSINPCSPSERIQFITPGHDISTVPPAYVAYPTIQSVLSALNDVSVEENTS